MEVDTIKREEIGELIFQKLSQNRDQLQKQYAHAKEKIGYFYIDDLLPVEIVESINAYFPKPEDMTLKKSLRENKHIAAQMDQYNPILEETIYAFQTKKVIDLIKNICQVDELFPDKHLYAGGISSMKKGQFLNPHLDNSHDKERNQWRVFNLLFYVTPNWKNENGGHLEIWPDGLKEKQITLHSKFNRLIVMATHQSSWHSVSPVISDDSSRKCISNYYFSNQPNLPTDTFHVTTFRGWPEQKIRNRILKIDSFLRMNIRKLFKKGIVKNPHVYKK